MGQPLRHAAGGVSRVQPRLAFARNSDDESCPNLTSRLTFTASAGSTYRIAVDGKDGASGEVTLNWRPGMLITPPTQEAGAIHFNVNGWIGDRYLIETSTDLTVWTLWLRATNTTGSVPVVDPGLAANPHQFYRVRAE